MVTGKDAESICLDVGGLGFHVLCSGSILGSARTGENLRISTHLQVTEKGIGLYGFSCEEERALFTLLTQVKGVGSRLAITLMRHIELKELIQAIAASRSSVLSSAPGIGAKTAERLCFELKSKIEKMETGPLSHLMTGAHRIDSVLEALTVLGFSPAEAQGAATMALDELADTPEASEELLLQKALAFLQKR